MEEHSRPFRVLCLHGGGYLGLATAAFLQECERHFNSRCEKSFDLFCGTSTGAIIALGLASGMSASEVVALYQEFGRTVFPPAALPAKVLRSCKRLVLSKYDNDALRESLSAAFGNTTLADLLGRKKYVLVTAFCLTTGRPRIFKTDHAPELSGHGGYRLCDIALASSAAPTYFPLATLPSPTGGPTELFCDGGVFANDPALLGYAEAVSHLGCKPADVEILSISAPRRSLSRTRRPRFLKRGVLGWANPLASIFIDGPSEVGHEALRRITDSSGACYVRMRLAAPGHAGSAKLDLDSATDDAANALLSIGHDAAQTSRVALQRFFR